MKILFSLVLILVINGCSSNKSGDIPKTISLGNKVFTPCPDRPNCVSTQSEAKKSSFIKPINIISPIEVAREKLLKIVSSEKGAKVVVKKENYLYLQYFSSVFKFVDDVEFLIDEKNKKILMRSASRAGYYDFGVNRDRLEKIRFRYHQNDIH